MTTARDIIAAAIAEHDGYNEHVPARFDGARPVWATSCQCGGWLIQGLDVEAWERHRADAVAAALRDAGHLTPDHADRIDPDTWPAVAEGITVRVIRQALNLVPSAPTVLARRIMADLTAAGLLSDPRAIVAATLRTAAEWGEFCTPETLREVADQAEDHHLSDGVCPVCQEVCCDETCPLASYRRSVCAQPATEETP